MIKKNLTLILIILLAFSCKINPVFSEESNEGLEIQKVINSFLEGFAKRDLNYLMEQISPNYYQMRNGEVFDYKRIKSIQGDYINKFYKNHTNYRDSDIKITNLVINGDKATLNLEFKWKAFNSNKSQEEESAEKRFFALVKEGGSWKITRIRRIAANEN